MLGSTLSREQQIATIKQYNPYAAVVAGDPSSHDIGLRLPSGHTITVRTSIPPSFPSHPPVMQILERECRHTWLDPAQRVIGSPDLNAWHPAKILGAVVQGVIGHFSTSPPVYTPAAAGGPPAPARPDAAGAGAPSSTPSQERSRASRRTAIPDVPFDFPELKEMSVSELKRLTSDQAALTDFVKSMESVKVFRDIALSTKRSNLETAQATLAKEAEVEAIQGTMDVLRVESMTVKQEYEAVRQRYDSVMSRYSTPVIIGKLKDRAMAMDTEAEDTVQDYIDAGPTDDLRDFLRAFVTNRETYHRVRAKSEMLRLQPPSGR